MGNCQIQSLLHKGSTLLKSTTEEEQIEGMRSIIEHFCIQFDNQKKSLKRYQQTATELGLIESLCLHASHLSPYHQDLAFDALKWICLDNKDVCVYVLSQPGLFDELTKLVNIAAVDDFFIDQEHHRNESAIRLLNTVTRSVWSAHKTLQKALLKSIIKIVLREDTPISVRVQALTFICILSSNPECKASLIEGGVLNPILELIKANENIIGSSDESLTLVVSASISACNLLDESQYSTAFSTLQTTNLVNRLIEAFSRSISGLDYPAGSRRYFRGWTLLASIAKFGQAHHNKIILCQNGLANLLEKALRNPKAHPRLHKYSLLVLQDLSVCTQSYLHPTPALAAKNTYQLLGQVLTTIVKKNDEFYKSKVMEFQEKTIFETNLKACMSVEQYLERIHEFSRCSDECFLIAPILIGRLEMSYGKPLIRSSTIHRLIISAVMIAAKTHDDDYLNNKCYSQIGGMSLKDINKLEIEFLRKIGYFGTVKTEDYRMCRKALEVLVSGGQLFTPKTTHFEMSNLVEEKGIVVPWPGVIRRPTPTNSKDEDSADFPMVNGSYLFCLKLRE